MDDLDSMTSVLLGKISLQKNDSTVLQPASNSFYVVGFVKIPFTLIEKANCLTIIT